MSVFSFQTLHPISPFQVPTGGVRISWDVKILLGVEIGGEVEIWSLLDWWGRVPAQPGYNGKPYGPKIFKATQIVWFLSTKFLQKGFIF